jgi:hypothetical protein
VLCATHCVRPRVYLGCLLRCNEAGKTQGKDNSILKMKITMVLTAGDPLFKMPGVANAPRDAVEKSSVDEAGTVSEGNARITADLDASLVRPVLTTALPAVFGRICFRLFSTSLSGAVLRTPRIYFAYGWRIHACNFGS